MSNSVTLNRDMELQQILTSLDRNAGRYEREAVSAAIACRDEIIPALLAVLEDVARDPEPFLHDEDRIIHIYAMYLLAQFQETRAYPLLVNIFSAPGEFAFELVGDTVTEGLGRILASVSGGDASGMAALIENEDANEYVRAAAMGGLLTLCACGSLTRDELMAYFSSLFHKLQRTPGFAWDELANSCADLCPIEVMEDLRQAFETDLIDPRFIAWDDIEDALAVGKEQAMAKLQSKYRLVSDVHDEMSWWHCFNEEQRSAVRDEFLLPSEPAVVDPIYRTEPKVGRNEPCPCGSGKKFKKCCGR
jgi:uncharacterized protein DUF1186/SEC-C motif-containing protein